MSALAPRLSRLAMAGVRMLGWGLLPWLALQGCAHVRAPVEFPFRSSPVRPIPFGAPRVAADVFPNGMRVVVREDIDAFWTTMSMFYRVGASDEPAGKEGLADLAARVTLMARHGGASSPTLEERLDAASMSSNYAVTQDDTELESLLPAGDLASVLELEAQRMRDPLANVSEEDFRRVRAQHVDDVWWRYEASDKGPARRWLFEKLLVGHAYARPERGIPESIDRITLEDVRAFVKANYTPARAVLVVSGHLRLENVRFEVARAFAGLSGGGSETHTPPVERVPPPAPKEVAGKVPLAVVRGTVKAPQLHFLLTLPGRYSGKYAEGKAALHVIEAWSQAQLVQGEDAPRRFGTTLYQELDGMTVIDCAFELTRNVSEAEARKLAADMVATLETSRDKTIEGLEGRKQGARGLAERRLLARMKMDLQQVETRAPVANIARLFRATGRVDIPRLQQEQATRALSTGALPPYLRQYVRGERVRTLLILP